MVMRNDAGGRSLPGDGPRDLFVQLAAAKPIASSRRMSVSITFTCEPGEAEALYRLLARLLPTDIERVMGPAVTTADVDAAANACDEITVALAKHLLASRRAKT